MSQSISIRVIGSLLTTYALGLSLACDERPTTPPPEVIQHPVEPATPEPPPPSHVDPIQPPAPARVAIDQDLMRSVRRLVKLADPSLLAPYVGEHTPIQIHTICSVCDPEDNGDTRETLASRAEFDRWLRTKGTQWGPQCRNGVDTPASCVWWNGLVILAPIQCDGRCCRNQFDMLEHSALYLDEICFAETAGTPQITSLTLTDGG